MKYLTLRSKKSTCFTLLLFIISLGISSCSTDTQQDEKYRTPVIEKLVSSNDLHNPTDIIKFKGHYISPELHKNRLAIFDTLNLKNVHHFDPKKIGKKFHAPHYLAISPNGHLLITNGWGKEIIEIEDINGSGWKEYSGPENSKFNAPHGICVDEEGWIYVGDSLNSRLVRFKDMQGSSWQVFKDVDNIISYSRQLICKDGAVWISNSYERRKGLNTGQGSNVLKITNFSSGKVEVMYEEKNVNISGILPLNNILLVAYWVNNNIIAVNLKTNKITLVKGSQNKLGIPYGFFENKDTDQIITSYFGDFNTNLGGFAILKR